jgi:hypothetical protein
MLLSKYIACITISCEVAKNEINEARHFRGTFFYFSKIRVLK